MNKKDALVGFLLVLCITNLAGFQILNSGTQVNELHVGTSHTESQEEFNISSYYDFALAAGDLIVRYLIELNTGHVLKYGDHNWSVWLLENFYSSLSDFYWAIAGLARIYELTGNNSLSLLISRAAVRMVELLKDPTNHGFFIDIFSVPEISSTKHAGVQAYAYWALDIAESVNSSLDFSEEKQSAIDCLTDYLYDPVYGGFYFFTAMNGSLDVGDLEWVYPNNGKRLDNMAAGASVLYDAGVATGNSTYIDIADRAIDFMIDNMRYRNESHYPELYYGFKIATSRTGSDLTVSPIHRPARAVVTDLNAWAIQALVKGWQVTGNSTHLDIATKTLRALINYNLDTEAAGWFTETLDGEAYDPIDDDTRFYKYSEIQFQMVLAMESLYEATGDLVSLQLIVDTLDIALGRLWDASDGGFVQNGDRYGAVLTLDWERHFTGIQAQGILALERMYGYGLPIVSYVRVTPSNPRPTDIIAYTATVLDTDGVDAVSVNYTVTYNSTDSEHQVELVPNLEVGGVYNQSIGTLPNGAQVNFIVIANDSLGTTYVAGSYYFIVREDVWAPSIELREVYPGIEPEQGDTVTIEVGTYEFPTHSGIVSCTLYWKLNDGPYEPFNMTLVGADGDHLVWRHQLGEFAAGDVISSYCHAVDEVGNLGESIFFRLHIQGPVIPATPLSVWQIVATLGLVAGIPGTYVGYKMIGRQGGRETERTLKKEAKKRARKRRSSKSRSRSR